MRPPGPGSVVATLWYGLFFALTAPVLYLAGALLYLATATFDRRRSWMHRYVCRIGWLYLRAWPGWRVSVEGREHLPGGAAVWIANHQSMADVMAVLNLSRDFRFVSKASLFKVPMVGAMMRMAGYVALERGRPGSTRRMLERCREWLAQGVPVLLFPEGTYAPGPELLPFKRGAFELATELDLPVVPIVLSGMTSLVREDGPWMSPRAHVRIRVLPPLLSAAHGHDPVRLCAAAREQMQAQLGDR